MLKDVEMLNNITYGIEEDDKLGDFLHLFKNGKVIGLIMLKKRANIIVLNNKLISIEDLRKYSSVAYCYQNSFIDVNVCKIELTIEELDYIIYLFDKYVTNNVRLKYGDFYDEFKI